MQYELDSRYHNRSRGKHHIFSGRIQCSCCGSWYGRKTWYSTTTPAVVWQCNHKYDKHQNICTSPSIKEHQLEIYYLDALKQLLENHAEKENLTSAFINALDTTKIKQQIHLAEQDVEHTRQALEELIYENQTAQRNRTTKPKRLPKPLQRDRKSLPQRTTKT